MTRCICRTLESIAANRADPSFSSPFNSLSTALRSDDAWLISDLLTVCKEGSSQKKYVKWINIAYIILLLDIYTTTHFNHNDVRIA